MDGDCLRAFTSDRPRTAPENKTAALVGRAAVRVVWFSEW